MNSPETAEALPTDATPRHPLTIWHDDFKLQVTSLRQLLQLRTRTGDTSAREGMKQGLREIGETVTQLEGAIAAVRAFVAAERGEFARLQAFRERVARQKTRIALIRAHLPPEVAAQFAAAASGGGKENDAGAANCDAECPSPAAAQQPAHDVVAATAAPVNGVKKKRSGPGATPRAGNASAPAAKGRPATKARPKTAKARTPAAAASPKQAERAGSADSDDGPVVRSLCEGELSAVPQYARGRLTVAKVDDVAKRLTAVARGKYALLDRPLKKLSSADRAHVDGFREADCDETRGLVFLTDAEIKGFGKMRLDANVNAVINVLRHVGSLKELRGKNRSRVFIIN